MDLVDDTDAQDNLPDSIKKARKARFAYKEADDIKLLQEVLSDDGLFVKGTKEAQQWRGIHLRLCGGGMDVSEHSFKRRLKTIHESFRATDRESQAASGVDETVDEKAVLLQEYHELLREQKLEEDEKKTRQDAEEKQDNGGRALRDAALTTFERQKAEENHEKPSKFDINDYLRETLQARISEREDKADTKRQRLELDNRMITLQESMIQWQKEATQMQHEMLRMMAALIEISQK
ncbi:unnamed protein product [Aphanomyces euteiches]|uniref:Uncharacterized protein n=1 Tax=Aphanomyces euteiches TaxID=100861 RepID=A0A6G0XWM3_9STRA|nr:hypothetical protein Ae201684_000697 [Aphanomyces euteiches]KAH9091888.1 hypothetical protein Ae201684P_011431 [Aphanomyces euteiches]KAH9153630.1 hypothetical protein AeRB84_004151 [Aphanomyces euteiches]